MKKRMKLSKGASKRIFKSGAKRKHKYNNITIMRGGLRL